MRLIFLLFSITFAFGANAQQTYLVDWNDVGAESIDHLVELIQINSSNPPGNETEVALYLKQALAVEGVQSDIYALDDSRANLVARIKGNGSKRPILVLAHTQMVCRSV
jgi:acetylornithine deacetylase/succinyl-diaminopimelate desuccinylase-like protein